MFLSVIIPTCDRNDLLSKCLDCMDYSIQQRGNFYEVIVTDDSKSSETKTLIEEKYPWVIFVDGPKRGPAANRNHGAKYAKGDWLIFVDDDCLPDKNLIEEYARAINNTPYILAYEGRIYVDTPQTSFLQEAPLNDSGGFFWSCNMCVNKSLFNNLNGFDENFPFAAMEDVDFFERLKKLTDKYRFLYNVAVLHPWRTNQNLFKTIMKRYSAQLYYISKHPEERIRMNYKFYFRSFIIFFTSTLRNVWKFRFSGVGRKICCDFLQIYFGFRALFKLDKEYHSPVPKASKR